MWVRIVVAALLVGGTGGLAAAQPAPPTTPAAPAAPTVPDEPPSQQIELSLHEAIALGIENNTGVQLIRYEPPIAANDYEAAWGAYDPNLFGNYSYTNSSLPVANTFLPGQYKERVSSGDAGVSGLVPRLGWTYSLVYHGDGTRTNSFVDTLAKTYTTSLTTTITAPLLKGAWWGGAWTQVELSGIQSELALEQFRERLMDIVGGIPGLPVDQQVGIEQTYWSLAARKQELEVTDKSLETARALLEQVKAQYDVGVVSRVEVVEAEAGVADREFRKITALNFYRAAQDELIDLVYGPRLTPTSRLEIVPTDKPESYVTFALDPERSTQRAMEKRPELVIAQQQVAQSEIQVKFRKNQRLPQLDAIGSFGTHGLAGNDPNCSFSDLIAGTCPVPNAPQQPPGIGTRYEDASDLWWKGGSNRVWVGGAQFSIPIPNTTARANLRSSELELRRAHTNVKRTEQDIVKQVRAAVRNLASALEGVEAAERNVAASAEQLRAEKIRLEHGESTPFDVLLRESDLVTAESQRIAALRVYHGSVTGLDRAQGTLLEDRGIVLDEALPLR